METSTNTAEHENWIAPEEEPAKPMSQEANHEEIEIATEKQRVFSLESAKIAETNGMLGEWLQLYLKSAEADNLKLADRILVGGCENYALRTISIDSLARVAGPEEGMMYQETYEMWEQKMRPLRDAVRAGDDFPPLILTDLWNPLRNDNRLVLSDGSHRLEALRESGVQSTTVLVAFRDSHSFQNILGEESSKDQKEPIETYEVPKPKRMLVVNVHPYEDVTLARRAIGSIVENLEETHPDGRVVISLTDDSKSTEARMGMSEIVNEANQRLKETNPNSYDIEYLQANGNEFINKLTQKLKEKGISERQLRFLLSTKMSSGYVGYTASVNQGALRAMYLSGLNGLPRDKSMIFHFDQDEMLKAYNPPHEENAIEYTAEDNDFLGDRFRALKEGAEIVGAKYAVHPGSTASMLKDITDYVRAGLEEFEKDPADLKRRVPLPISVSEDGENYQIEYLTVEDFLVKLPSIVAASTRRTPVVGYKETSDFDKRVQTNDFTEPPVSRTIRLDTSRKLFDPHNMGMHEIIWFLGARAMTEELEAVKRLPYHIHHRSAEFGNDLQGADLFAETHPHAVQFVYEVGLLSDDELSTNFNPQEQTILKRVRENLGNDASKKIVKKLDTADENLNRIEAIVDNMPDNQLTTEAISTLRDFSQKFDGFYPQFKDRFNDKIDHEALIKEIKRYFRQQQAWQKICDTSFELGVEDAKAQSFDETVEIPIPNEYLRRGVSVKFKPLETQVVTPHKTLKAGQLVAVKTNAPGFYDRSQQKFVNEPVFLQDPEQDNYQRHSLEDMKKEREIMKKALFSADLTRYIPELIEGGVDEVVTEYAGGETLRDMQNNEWSVEQQEAVIVQLIDYVYNMHTQGIYHNDLHGSKIFIQDDNKIKVIDYSDAGEEDKRLPDEDTDIGRLNRHIANILGSNNTTFERPLSSEELAKVPHLTNILEKIPLSEESLRQVHEEITAFL